MKCIDLSLTNKSDEELLHDIEYAVDSRISNFNNAKIQITRGLKTLKTQRNIEIEILKKYNFYK